METIQSLVDGIAFDMACLRGMHLITIDGDQGAGKTHLANNLGNYLSGTVISMDDFLLSNGNPNLDQIKWTELSTKISDSDTVPVILEGVLMNQVLERLGMQSEFRIFAKLEVFGKWDYQQYLPKKVPLPSAQLTREIVSYYRDYEPWKTADLIQTLIYDPFKDQCRIKMV